MAAHALYSITRDKLVESSVYQNALLALEDWARYVLIATAKVLGTVLQTVAINAAVEIVIFSLCLFAAHVILMIVVQALLSSMRYGTGVFKGICEKVLSLALSIAHLIVVLAGAFVLYSYASTTDLKDVVRPLLAYATGLRDATIRPSHAIIDEGRQIASEEYPKALPTAADEDDEALGNFDVDLYY